MCEVINTNSGEGRSLVVRVLMAPWWIIVSIIETNLKLTLLSLFYYTYSFLLFRVSRIHWPVIFFILWPANYYKTSQAAVSVNINNFLICFCGFELSFPILKKCNFIENMHIVLFCLIKWCSFLTLFIFSYNHEI